MEEEEKRKIAIQFDKDLNIISAEWYDEEDEEEEQVATNIPDIAKTE